MFISRYSIDVYGRIFTEDSVEKNHYDLIIIGSGPAGLSAAQYGGRSNLKTLVFEQKSTGGQALVINNLENYPGIFPSVNGFDFSENMKKQAEAFGAQFITDKVTAIDKIGKTFKIKTETDHFLAQAVIIATGAAHRQLGIKGELEFSGKGVSYCATCDGFFFKNKHIVVVGGGDSACDEANFLSNLTTHITMIHRKHKLRAQKTVAHRVLHNPNITVQFAAKVLEIKGSTKVESIIIENTETQAVSELVCDAVFIFIGMDPQTELIQTVKQDEAGYVLTNERMETSVKGLFCAGDVRAKPFRQIVTAASDGAIAVKAALDYIEELNQESYE